ncbi:latrophilin Cirl [Caerostris extrusa]|uniref:Latrophilin Cirl n=1 Tax=Caerostris extrusa TaxID=172846 RepID=A0AAV4Q3Z4_CAEEX|nr:latrophilin Cirl [Caerostris extrusa]
MKYDGFDGVLRNFGPRSETTHRYSCRRIIEMLSPDLVYDLKLEWSLLRFEVGGQKPVFSLSCLPDGNEGPIPETVSRNCVRAICQWCASRSPLHPPPRASADPRTLLHYPLEENKYRTAYACEGRQLQISCEPGHMIHLLRANYGRFSISICNEHGNLDWSVDCTSHNSFNVIKDTCGMKNSCSLSASPTLFGDPCPGTPKYLEAHYQCTAEKSAVTPSTSTTTSTSSSTSTSRPSIIIPVTPNRNARPHHVVPPSSPPAAPSTTPAAITLRDATSEAAAVAAVTTTVTTLLVDVTTTLADSLLMMISGTPETSTSEPSTVHLSRFSPENREDDPHNTMSCFPTEARGLFWNWTRAGHMALHKCPGGGTGRVKWRCDAVTVQWIPESPDFSDCSSQWVENLKYRMARGDPITSLAAELAAGGGNGREDPDDGRPPAATEGTARTSGVCIGSEQQSAG